MISHMKPSDYFWSWAIWTTYAPKMSILRSRFGQNWPTSQNSLKIFEKSIVISYNHKKEIHVKTNNGSVTCEKLVFAINAWTPNFLPFL